MKLPRISIAVWLMVAPLLLALPVFTAGGHGDTGAVFSPEPGIVVQQAGAAEAIQCRDTGGQDGLPVVRTSVYATSIYIPLIFLFKTKRKRKKELVPVPDTVDNRQL